MTLQLLNVKVSRNCVVPVFLHDFYGPGRTAKVSSTLDATLMRDGTAWHQISRFTP